MHAIPYELRRANLALLIRFYDNGNMSAFTRRVGISNPSYTQRLLYGPNEAGHKKLGEELALKITNALGLPYGFLDSKISIETIGVLKNENHTITH
jgi:hypothetical protein